MKFLLFTIFLTSCTSLNYHIKNSYTVIQPKEITEKELTYLYRTTDPSNLLIIDTRSASQFQKQHLSNAKSLPLRYFNQITNISDIQQKKIILYHNKDLLPFYQEKLMDYNIENYYILKGGVQSLTNKELIINNTNKENQ